MVEKTTKELRIDELSEQYDWIEEKLGKSGSMFDGYNIIAPYSDARVPEPKRWCEGNLVTIKNPHLK